MTEKVLTKSELVTILFFLKEAGRDLQSARNTAQRDAEPICPRPGSSGA